MNKHLEHIIKTMCMYANVDYDKLNVDDTFWFDTYSWLPETQDKFRNWLIEYMIENPQARKELMRVPTKNKKMVSRFVDMFILNYGFKCE